MLAARSAFMTARYSTMVRVVAVKGKWIHIVGYSRAVLSVGPAVDLGSSGPGRAGGPGSLVARRTPRLSLRWRHL